MPDGLQAPTRTPQTTTSQPAAKVIARAPWPDTVSERARELLALPSLHDALDGAGKLNSRAVVDVAVVGAGVTGLSAAYAAAAAGAQTLLLEAAPALGAGASGRNAGILSAGANAPLVELDPSDPVAALWPATTAILLELVAEAQKPGAIVRAQRTGALDLATSATAARRLEGEARVRRAAGLQAEMWTTAQVAERTGGRLNTDGVVAALWLPDEGRIQPLTMLAHLAQRARAAGATLVGEAAVASCSETVTKRHGGVWTLTLRTGMTISARGLVWCVGPTVHPTSRLYALGFLADLPDDFPVFWDAAPYVYYDYRAGDGRLVVSGGRYGQPGATSRDAAYHERMAQAACRWLPELADQTPRYAWAVDLDTAADRLPAFVPMEGAAPGLAIEGLGAQGVLPGIALGRQAGAEIAARVLK